jgi:RHS repeat-associated protein
LLAWNYWGTGVTALSQYTFTAGDAGQHMFTPKFKYAGDQTATVTDTALAARTVTTSVLAVTNSAAGTYSHHATPSGVKLADGSTLWAHLGVRGRIYARRNVGTLTDPAWRAQVLVRDTTAGQVGADTPSLVTLGGTVALFHSYTDGTYFQVWLTTSTDSGATWSAPVQITTETGHVQRVQALVSGGTVSVFWSRQDTNGTVFYRSSSDLTNWTARTQLSQSIGVPVLNTTSNFGIARLSSGTWVLGWVAPSAVGEPPSAPANSLSWPVVKVATSTDLSTWTSPVELNLAASQRLPESVALAQDPATGLLWAAFERFTAPSDRYIAARSSTDGLSWTAASIVSYERSLPADGNQHYDAHYPALVAGSMAGASSVSFTPTGGAGGWYGTACWGAPGGGEGVPPFDPPSPTVEPPPLPIMPGDPREVESPTGPCGSAGDPVCALSGRFWVTGTDLIVPAKGMPLVVQRTYNSFNAIAGQDGPFGYGWTWRYHTRAVTRADGSVTVVEADGQRANFWKTGGAWTAGPHINATLTSAMGGGYVLTRHDQSVWTFDAGGKLTSIAGRSGNAHTLTYTGTNLSSVAAAGGRTLTITTNAQGRITAINGPGGLSTSYTYSAAGDLLTATDASGGVWTYTYDARHQLLTWRNPNNQVVMTNTYGALGRVQEQRDALNNLSVLAYSAEQTASGLLGYNQLTDARGTRTRYYADGNWRLTQRDVLDAGSAVVQRLAFTYNANGDVLSVSRSVPGSVIHTDSFTYDSKANVLTATRDSSFGGLALQSTFTYNATNDLLTATDPLSHTRSFTYDAQGNRLTATDALTNTTTFTYDGAGQLLTATDATNRTTTFGYSAAGDLTTITVPGGAAWTMAYDGAGRPTSLTDPLMHTTTVAMDGMRRITAVTNALNQTTNVLYDAAGNRTRITDALNRQTNFAYDAANRLTSVTDAMTPAGVTSYQYDANSNLTRVTNALGRQWNYTYDLLDRLLTATDPLNNQTQYTYDAYGNVATVRKPDLTTNKYIYDRIERLTGIDFGNNGSNDITYAYDNASRRTSMTDGTGTTSYVYDNADRLTSTTAPTTGTVGYGYDGAGRRTSLTYPSGRQVTYGYTNRGELASVTAWTVGTTQYTYDSAGRLTGIALPNGVTSTLTYDIADRLTRMTHAWGMTTLEDIQYVLNAVGNRTQMTDSAGTTSWTYDNLDRLTNVSYPNGDTVAYGYDAVGNRTSHTINGVPKTNTFDAANRMTASGTDTYTYDANGNQLTRTSGGTTTTYSYDALDRLTGISGPVTASYSYNGDGLRVRRVVGGATTNYAWDTVNLARVIDDGNEYIWGRELISRVAAGTTATYSHGDALGSIRLLTDSTGAVVGSQQYDAFGATRSQTGAQMPFTFTGNIIDIESNFLYLRARYVDPSNGRFLTLDPYPGLYDRPMSQHRYTYVENNPTNVLDPSGLSSNCTDDDDRNFIECVLSCMRDNARTFFGVAGTIAVGLASFCTYPAVRTYRLFAKLSPIQRSVLGLGFGAPLIAAHHAFISCMRADAYLILLAEDLWTSAYVGYCLGWCGGEAIYGPVT